jgi:hypothetical protein
MDEPAAPIDSTALDAICDRARTHSLVEQIRREQTGSSVSMVVLRLSTDRYPEYVQEARVEIQWYTNDDYNFHYVEQHASEDIWQCRWDRHPNPHTARAHFHPPPEADSTAAIADQPEDQHPSAMFTRTFANIRDRIADLWAE